MKIIVVDDEKLALDNMVLILNSLPQKHNITTFSTSSDCLKHVESNRADLAFLDINMCQMDGLTLANQIRNIQPNTYVVFVTVYSQYAVSAFKVRASGYLLKPVSVTEVQEEIENVERYKNIDSENRFHTPQIRIQTFGNFEVFYDDKPLTFYRNKSKEMLAYLVDRNGATATMAQIAAVFWEDGMYDRSRQKQMQTFAYDLKRTLETVNSENIVIKYRTGMAIDKSRIKCDYYSYLQGDENAAKSYTGEYMSNYSWAEYTAAYIESREQLRYM